MNWYNKATKKKLTDAEYQALSDEDKKNCREWKDKPPREQGNGKPGAKKQDGKWYEITPQLTKDVGNFAYNRFTGVEERLDYAIVGGATPGVHEQSTVTPGVMAIDFVPTFGASNDPSSAINIAMRSLYTYVRHWNSGKTNYEGPDLMIYIAAMSQVYAALENAKRIYELAMTYTYENKYMPTAIFKALGVDYAAVSADLANFRAGLNLRINKVKALVVPEMFNIHKRHAYLCRNVFFDSSSLRGQMYVFRPAGFLQYSATSNRTGGSLQYLAWMSETGAPMFASDILSYLDKLIDPLLMDMDSNTMSGDIQKAFTEKGYKIYSIDEEPDNARASFVFNEDLLQQIENAQTLMPGMTFNYVTYTQTQPAPMSSQDTYLTSNVSVTGSAVQLYSFYFNSHKDEIAPIDNLEWSRLMSPSKINFGTELVLSFTIVTADYQNKGAWVLHQPIKSVMSLTAAKSATDAKASKSGEVRTAPEDLLTLLALLSQFDWHPTVLVFKAVTGALTYLGKYVDLKNYFIMVDQDLKRLNDACVMGALNSLSLLARETGK